MIVGVIVALLGFGLSHLASTDRNPQIATDLCHQTLASHAAVPVVFAPAPVVVRAGDVFTISGGATVGSKPTDYSCDVTLQGDKLVVTQQDFGD
jgi:hypothetical protein